MLKIYTYESDEFHRKLSHEWHSFIIFASDWIIDRNGLENIDRLFDVATSFASQLMFTRRKNSGGFEIIRFFIVFPSKEMCSNFITEAIQLLPLEEWFQISKDDLPNVVTGNPANFTNGYAVWREGLIEAAASNKRLNLQ